MRFVAVLICLVLAVPVGGAGAQSLPPAAQRAMLRAVLPSVVSITVRLKAAKAPAPSAASAATPTQDKEEFGAGFVIDAAGVIVTNYHVVENAWEIIVGFSDGVRVQAKLWKATKLVDLALLKVDVGHPLPVVRWGDSDRLLVGAPVMAIGNPFGVGISVTGGIVSALNRDISDSPYDDFIQTDAAINHGNSGGPLIDMGGRVVGLNTALISPTKAASGLGFAIPAAATQRIIARLEAYGWLRPGWVGMKVQQISVGIARAFGLPKADGSIVASVAPGGPAEKGGLQVGDIIVRVGDAAPSDERALLRMIATTPIGQNLAIGVLRDGQTRTLSIAVAAWPKEQWDLIDPPVAMPPVRPVPEDLGLSLEPATGAALSKFGVEDPRPGVLVTAVRSDTDAADRGLVPGDIIMQVMGRDVTTPADLSAQLQAARSGPNDFIAVLIWPKVRAKPGPEWLPLRLKN